MTLDKRSDKKKQFIVFIVLITVLVFFRELTAVLNGMDEIRNYNLSRGIVMGCSLQGFQYGHGTPL